MSVDRSVQVFTLQGDTVGQNEHMYAHKDSVYSVVFSPDGKQLVTGSLDKTVKLWDLDSSGHAQIKQALKCAKTFKGHKVSYHPHGVCKQGLT